MFTAEEIRKILKQTPFQPLRFHLSDGSYHDVPHPEMLIVTRNFIEVPTGVDEKGVADSVMRLAILHISKVEELKKQAA